VSRIGVKYTEREFFAARQAKIAKQEILVERTKPKKQFE